MGRTDGASGVAHAVIKESFHDGAVLLEVEAVELILKVGSVFGGDCPNEVDILIRVEGGEFLLRGIVAVHLGEL